jgi:hypothetical protein
MRYQWQALRELIWSSRHDPIASHERRMAMLQAIIAMAIALSAGPEIFAAMEMTALMEVLGTVLFLAAMSAGAKLVALRVWRAIHDCIFPVPPAAVLQSCTSTPARAVAAIGLAGHAMWCLVLALNCRYVGSSESSR